MRLGGVMVGSLVWVRLVTRSTLSTGLQPRRPMVVVEAGDVHGRLVVGVVGGVVSGADGRGRVGVGWVVAVVVAGLLGRCGVGGRP